MKAVILLLLRSTWQSIGFPSNNKNLNFGSGISLKTYYLKVRIKAI